MIKEKLINKLDRDYISSSELRSIIEDFYEQNVVIPKGTNRHPYADVLHEWIEGAEIQVKIDANWSDYRCSRSYIDTFEYRIKPSDPIYEAVVRIHYADGTYEDTEKYFTYEEFENFGFPKSCEWVESTKKVRQ